MHDDQLVSDAELVREILRDQQPKWADGPITEISSTGTDHALYRLGDDAVARVPLRESATRPIDTEFRWLPWLAERLPAEVPRPLARLKPTPSFPYPWSVHSWIDGECATTAPIDRALLAVDLARVLRTLQGLDTDGVPPAVEAYCWRGIPLRMRDGAMRDAIASSRRSIDLAAVTSAWETALDTPEWTGPPVWVHGDVAAGNLIFRNGRLVGVIDWACMAVGDPACDLVVAWELLDESSRETFRAELAIDDAAWERGRGWALSTAVSALAYYQDSNPFMANQACRKLRSLLGDDAVLPPAL
jgi:aminoglycoside phosphotransferase (APT) family kinase protein